LTFDRFKLENNRLTFLPLFFLGFIQAIGCLGVVGLEKAAGGEFHGEEGLPMVEGGREGTVEN
jgi:hypothetical protein